MIQRQLNHEALISQLLTQLTVKLPVNQCKTLIDSILLNF